MKKIIVTTIAFLSFMSFSIAQETEKVAGAKIVFDKLIHDYGEIVKNGDGNCVFTFKNEGTEPLLLTGVNTSCGCAAPSWTKEPIMPGKTGTVKIHYNTAIVGSINKSIVVTSNSQNNNREILKIKGTATTN